MSNRAQCHEQLALKTSSRASAIRARVLWLSARPLSRANFEQFCSEETHWLDDYALVTFRPGDANEVVEACQYIMKLRYKPTVLIQIATYETKNSS